MSDFDWEDEYDEGETLQGPKALRQLYEKQKREKADLEKQLEGLTARVRQQELSGQFASRGIPEKAVGLFPKDLDPTEENIKKFVADYGDLFNVSKPAETQVQASEPTAQNVNAETQRQFTQMSAVTETAQPSTSTARQNFESMLNNPNLYDEVSHADFMKAMRELSKS